jgi:hypothetical protein
MEPPRAGGWGLGSSEKDKTNPKVIQIQDLNPKSEKAYLFLYPGSPEGESLHLTDGLGTFSLDSFFLLQARKTPLGLRKDEPNLS